MRGGQVATKQPPVRNSTCNQKTTGRCPKLRAAWDLSRTASSITSKSSKLQRPTQFGPATSRGWPSRHPAYGPCHPVDGSCLRVGGQCRRGAARPTAPGPPFDPRRAPYATRRRPPTESRECSAKNRSQFGRHGGSSTAKAPLPRRSRDAGKWPPNNRPFKIVPASDQHRSVAQAACSLGSSPLRRATSHSRSRTGAPQIHS